MNHVVNMKDSGPCRGKNKCRDHEWISVIWCLKNSKKRVKAHLVVKEAEREAKGVREGKEKEEKKK